MRGGGAALGVGAARPRVDRFQRGLLASCQDTPMRTANGLVKWCCSVLDPDALWRVGGGR